MSPDGTIRAEHVWKRFRARLGRMLMRDQLAGIGDRVRRSSADPNRGWRWALQDVDLRIAPGEAVGLIGANGSGKSTLLKLLTRVMYPYAGDIEVKGRVGALIEVRAGMHGDLTGRENMFLYGSLLGLGRKGVAQKFDEIVAFAELEDAVDRQVKFYSSGMQMRLGFAVAAFLEPHVLLVDEVLAVGDASFQQKCLDRMRAVISQGATLVFVSHDLAAVQSICTRGVWLTNGMVARDGPVNEVLGDYRQAIEKRVVLQSHADGPVRLLKMEVAGGDGGFPRTQGPLAVKLVAQSDDARFARVSIGITEGPPTPVFVISRDLNLAAGQTEINCLIPRLPLARGTFFVWLCFQDRDGRELLSWQPAGQIEVAGPVLDFAPRAVVRLAPVHVEASWEVGR